VQEARANVGAELVDCLDNNIYDPALQGARVALGHGRCP
jgi:hypothetical protein